MTTDKVLDAKCGDSTLGNVSQEEFRKLRKRVGGWSVMWRGDVSQVVVMCQMVGRVVGVNGSNVRVVRGMQVLGEVKKLLERLYREMSGRVRLSCDGRVAGGRSSLGEYVELNIGLVNCEISRRLELSAKVGEERQDWKNKGGEYGDVYGVF